MSHDNPKCRKFDRRVQLLLDQRANLTHDDWLIDHASACPRCEELLKLHVDVDDSCRWMKLQTFQVDVSSKVTGPGTVFGLKLRAWSRRYGVVLAAVLLLLLPLAWRLSQPERAQPSMPTIAHGQPAVAPVRPPAHLAELWNESAAFVSGLPWAEVYQPLWDDQIVRNVSDWGPIQSLSQIYQLPDQFHSLQRWPTQINHLQPYYQYYQYTAELPGVKSWKSGIEYTVNIIRQSIPAKRPPPVEKQPDMGMQLPPAFVLCWT